MIRDHEWLMEREAALQVPCTDCAAVGGEPCRNLRTGQPLEHQTAHRVRVQASKEVPA